MKKTVLFVDDEQNIIQGLKRMLYNMRNEWNMIFVTSGNEAINILSKNHVDIIVSDMRMPGMDGAELLNYVMIHYPPVIRIILSGYSDQDMILRSVKTAHQFLTKPCDSQTLIQTISKVYSLRNLIKNESLVMEISKIISLPSLPSLYYEIEEKIQNNTVSLTEIGDIIAQDVVMTAKVLQLVNSAFFCLSQTITSPQQATAFLGLNTLKTLVIYVHVFNIIENIPGLGFSFEDFWNHSVIVSKISREIAKSEFDNTHLIEVASTAGLLHDIGKLILIQIPEYYNQVESLVSKTGCSHTQAEYDIFGTSHAEVGAYMLGKWGIPDSIIEVIAYHHQTSSIECTVHSVLTVVHVANGLVLKEKDDDGQVFYPKIDINYQNSLKLLGKLEIWESITDNLMRTK